MGRRWAPFGCIPGWWSFCPTEVSIGQISRRSSSEISSLDLWSRKCLFSGHHIGDFYKCTPSESHFNSEIDNAYPCMRTASLQRWTASGGWVRARMWCIHTCRTHEKNKFCSKGKKSVRRQTCQLQHLPHHDWNSIHDACTSYAQMDKSECPMSTPNYSDWLPASELWCLAAKKI